MTSWTSGSPRSKAWTLARVVLRDVAQGLAGEEGLVRGDEHVGEGQQARQHVVLQHLVRQVLEEDPLLLLVDIEPGRADVAAS